VESRQVNSGFGHQGRQFGNEIHRLENHVGRASDKRRCGFKATKAPSRSCCLPIF
jgi:hypothetical protein